MADDIQGGKPTQKIAQAVSNLKGFLDTAPDQIKQDAEHVRSYYVLHRTLIIIAFVVMLVACFVVMRFLYVAIENKDKQINALTVKMGQRDVDIKGRDEEIKKLDADSKSKDAAIALSRDSINQAYQIIAKINTKQYTQYEKYKKDSAAIGSLSLHDKLSIITGGKR